MKILLSIALLLCSVSTVAASSQTILTCSDGLEYKNDLILTSRNGIYDKYRVMHTARFILCLKK